jgi:phosphoglycerate-specific signal transduction histidine kinase
MPDAILIRRIEILEQKVEGLELLPARMTTLESQILQLGDDMRVEFSAMRQEMATAISQLEERLVERIRSGDEETRRYMRVLHEDVIERISRIQEGPPPRRRKR